MVLISIYDKISKRYSPAYPYATKEEAIRTLTSLANAKEHQQSNLSQFPDDHEIFSLGTWDPETAKIEPCKPDFLCRVSDLISG